MYEVRVQAPGTPNSHSITNPIPGIPAVIIFKMQREKSRSRCLFLDGRNIFIFAFGLCQTFGSYKKKTLKKNTKKKTIHHFFQEHSQMTSARSHVSLYGAAPCTIHVALCLSIACHSYFNKSPISPGRQRAPELVNRYLWSACFVVGTRLGTGDTA